MTKRSQKPSIDGIYRPTQEMRTNIQKWIKRRDWFKNRHGRQYELLLTIAKDCGYTKLPKVHASIKALIGEHIAHFYSTELAAMFNQMADELTIGSL